MKHLNLILLFCLGSVELCFGDSMVTIGDVTLKIPAIDGFVDLMKVDGEIGALYLRSAQDGMNRNIATFLPRQVAENIRSISNLKDYDPSKLSVKTPVQTIQDTLDANQFSAIKNQIIKYFSAKSSLPDSVIESIENSLNTSMERHDVSVAYKFGDSVFLKPHWEGQNSIAVTGFISSTVNGKKRKMAITSVYLHIEGKVLQLSVDSSSDRAAWTREAARTWVAAIVAANHSADNNEEAKQ